MGRRTFRRPKAPNDFDSHELIIILIIAVVGFSCLIAVLMSQNKQVNKCESIKHLDFKYNDMVTINNGFYKGSGGYIKNKSYIYAKDTCNIRAFTVKIFNEEVKVNQDYLVLEKL